MNKPLCVISCAIDTFSGYGARSRDLVKALIESKKDEWDIKVIPQLWGSCPWGFIEQNKEKWGFLNEYLWKQPHLPKQPEIWIQITVPNEFQPVGKFNIGITAGIETTIAHPTWVEGINRMNLTLVSSEHAKETFMNSIAEQRNQQGQVIKLIKVEKPIEVLFEGVDLSNYFPINTKNIENDLVKSLNKIPESFVYLFVGHWMQGVLGEDRKNVGLLVKAFYEVFKNHPNPPALLLKTSGAGCSYIDRREILKKINEIKNTVKATNLPKVYLLHGEFTDEQINQLYNHPKIKAMVNLTKGEGFGRPLLEFSLTGKPIIATNWSGHIDFLKPKFTSLLKGNLTQIHSSAVVPNMLIPESSWFSVDYMSVGITLTNIFNNYDDFLKNSKQQALYSASNFSFDKMKIKLDTLLKQYIPEFPKAVELKLPNINFSKMELPKLKKIE